MPICLHIVCGWLLCYKGRLGSCNRDDGPPKSNILIIWTFEKKFSTSVPVKRSGEWRIHQVWSRSRPLSLMHVVAKNICSLHPLFQEGKGLLPISVLGLSKAVLPRREHIAAPDTADLPLGGCFQVLRHILNVCISSEYPHCLQTP